MRPPRASLLFADCCLRLLQLLPQAGAIRKASFVRIQADFRSLFCLRFAIICLISTCFGGDFWVIWYAFLQGLVSDFQWVSDFSQNGFAVIPSFATEQTADAMKTAMAGLIDAWEPQSSRNSVFHVNMEDAGEAALGAVEARFGGLLLTLFFLLFVLFLC